MADHHDDETRKLIDPAGDHRRAADAGLLMPGRFAVEGHVHPWPGDPACWCDMSACHVCGLTMLQVFIRSSDWVVRRVEHVTFLDECTVRRGVSIDYVAPSDAVTLSRPGGQYVRVLPLAIMRRKSLVNFDLRDHDGRALPLLGLRQNQALTLAAVRAWAAASLGEQSGTVSREVDDFLDDVIAGDQTELWRAYKRMWAADPGTQLRRLGKDQLFRVMLDRLADSFVLYGLHDGPAGERRVIKFSYDEPLTLRYAKPGYRATHDTMGNRQDKDENTGLRPFGWTTLSAAMGFSTTRIVFPVPAAELAASFHFEISAPPEVSIVKAALLAGRPKPEAKTPAPPAVGQVNGSAMMKERQRRRPSFDSIGGGFPTVDLHVAGVPYGSRSRVQVEVEARVGGWFATAVFSSWLASAILGFAYLARPKLDVGSALLVSFSAGLAALLVRNDPHRLVTRLLSKVRLLATFAAVLALAAAVVLAFDRPQAAHAWLLVLFIASIVPTALISSSWFLALRRSLRNDPQESPWEHHRPRKSKSSSQDPEQVAQLRDETRHATLARKLEDAPCPYDLAHEKLGFNRPAIRVASCESDRRTYPWNKEFADAFHRRLGEYLVVVTTQRPNSDHGSHEVELPYIVRRVEGEGPVIYSARSRRAAGV
jgi:hypothetical protein